MMCKRNTGGTAIQGTRSGGGALAMSHLIGAENEELTKQGTGHHRSGNEATASLGFAPNDNKACLNYS